MHNYILLLKNLIGLIQIVTWSSAQRYVLLNLCSYFDFFLRRITASCLRTHPVARQHFLFFHEVLRCIVLGWCHTFPPMMLLRPDFVFFLCLHEYHNHFHYPSRLYLIVSHILLFHLIRLQKTHGSDNIIELTSIFGLLPE